MKTRATLIRFAVFATASAALFGAYTYYYTDSLTSINTTYWTQNGTLTAGSGGLTSSTTDGGSLISKVAVPDGSSNYEVNTTLTLTQSGGTYVTYLRASSNALSGPAPAGTAYAIEVQNPTFSGGACTATLAAYKIISGAVTSLATTTIGCINGLNVRAIYTAISNQIAVYIDNVLMAGHYRLVHCERQTGNWGPGSALGEQHFTSGARRHLRRESHAAWLMKSAFLHFPLRQNSSGRARPRGLMDLALNSIGLNEMVPSWNLCITDLSSIRASRLRRPTPTRSSRTILISIASRTRSP